MNARKLIWSMFAAASGHCALAQVPDLLNALDAGGRAMGMGGGIYTAGADTFSIYNNPAALGFLDQPQFGAVLRNLPQTRTSVVTDFNNPGLSSTSAVGDRELTHFGIAYPLKTRGGGSNGTVGIAYTTAGFFRDNRSGTGLTDGALTLNNYAESLQLKVDFINFSYGKAAASGLNWGVGAAIATAYVQDFRVGNLVDSAGNARGNINQSVAKSEYGVGVLAGLQYVPPAHPNMSYGLSIRSPISLSGGGAASTFYSRVPGRVSFGVASRRDGLRNGQDYILFGVQLDDYFGGRTNELIPRKNQLAAGAGVEYNALFSDIRVPFRFGYNTIQSGGRGYTSRGTFTAGIGYHPINSGLGLDLDVAAPNTGSAGWDMAIGVTYRFGK